ncbi:MAG: hypothetical protein IAC55_07800 [Tyzzerella sp.]|uniref:Uncharacterized protein n=1 Tax=Candidatus Fimicola merdigallinarum TaxID=2840819 RepID=A0A9D9DZS2_9FIRM|nr:hypothetical protein [Candidatus Fimicola merdigallinarum]
MPDSIEDVTEALKFGLKAGALRAKIEVAINATDLGFDLKTIVYLTELKEEYVKQIMECDDEDITRCVEKLKEEMGYK